LKYLVVVLGLLLHVLSHTQSKQGTFTFVSIANDIYQAKNFQNSWLEHSVKL